ncbi:MAG: L,D-transpeptidase family protein [Actinomycetota bacterium]|nr:L,D-transpeptidase family protein [Actinomycetota bacterium]
MSGETRTRVIRMTAAGAGLAVTITAGVYALMSGGSDGDDKRKVVVAAPTSSTTTPSVVTEPPTTTTSTTVAEETTATETTPASPDGSLLELQEQLARLGYDIGTPDGFRGWRTHYAISAFQRVEGLARTGEDNAEVREALASATTPGPMVPGGQSTRVEIDLDRQVLFLWSGGSLARILPVSTGNGEYYCVEGECDTAITPTGTFRIGRKARGLEVSRLGELYDPMYFYGGIAIHGSPSVPGYPASHGCVRVPMYASPTLFDQVPSGTAVYVVGSGPAATDVPPPPDEPIPVTTPPVLPEPEPDPVVTTTTTTTTTTTLPPSSSTTTPPLTVPGGEGTTTTEP